MAKKKRPLTRSDDRKQGFLEPLPDRRTMEQVMRQLVANLGGEGPGGETPLDRAQEVMYQAFEAADAEQVRLARKALKISPDCADAYVLLAEHATTVDQAITLYEQGVDGGRRALGEKTFEEDAGHFWGILETRPYMRARQGLAECLWEAGRRDEAAEHYREMLWLNPNDNQGVRYSLATLLLDLEADDELRRLLLEYENDASAEWAYTRVLVAFRAEGESTAVKRLLKQATKVNKHVPAYLLAHKQLPADLPPYISRGGEDEAISYACGNLRAWRNTPGAISWMRKTLKAPLPKAPKPRRPSWPQLRLSLRRCPLEQSEIWQVDAVQVPGDDQDSSAEGPWVIMVIGNTGEGLFELEVCESEPKPIDVWNVLVDIMCNPPSGDPCRPGRIEVRQKSFQAAWRAKLKQIGVECELCDRLEAIETAYSEMTKSEAEAAGATINLEDVQQLPFEPGEVWQAALRRMPMWITGEGEPYRPWAALIVNRTDDLVLGCQTTPNRPTDEWFWGAIASAMCRPSVGRKHRPEAIEVCSADQRKAIMPYLEQAGVECILSDSLEHLDAAMESMGQHMAGKFGPPSLCNIPGMQPSRIGGFYEAAAEFYRNQPWRKVASDTIIKVECDKFQSGPWYAVVMGQSGMQQGVAIYEDLTGLWEMMTQTCSAEEGARNMAAISMMFSEAFEMSCRDLDAAEKYDWPVAGPEAYPMVIRVNPGCAIRPPLVWELELLESCLRMIPRFLSERIEQNSKTTPAANDALTLRLSWVAED